MGLASLYLGALSLLLSSTVIDCTRHKISKNAVLGAPGEDYPIYSTVPTTTFQCDESRPGYFADVEGLCQVFHICQADGRHDSFLCPNGTLFNQNYFVCDWWYNVDCSSSPSLYALNEVFKQTNSKTGKINSPVASIKSDASAARTEKGASTIQAVTTTAAREPSRHSSPKPYTNNQSVYTTKSANNSNTKETFGMKMPSVNRIGGHSTPLIRNLVSSEPATLVESTEATPMTTSQPFNEDEIRTELSVGEQLVLIPDLNADAKRKTLQYSDSYVANKKTATREKANSVVYPIVSTEVKEAHPKNPTFIYATAASRPHKAQSSAVAVTLNALSEKDLDDYATTTTSPLYIPNPTSNNFPQLREETTEYISVTDLATRRELATAESITTPTPNLLEPPAVVGLYFKVITDSSLGEGININHQSNTTLLPLKTQPSPSGYGININFSGSSTLIPAVISSTLPSITTTYITSTTERTTSSTTSYDSLPSIQLPTKPEEKRTVYDKLKPAIASRQVQPVAEVYGNKTPKTLKTSSSKITKSYKK